MKATVVTIQWIGASIIFKIFAFPFIIVASLVYCLFATIDVILGYYKNEVVNRTSARLSKGITTRVVKLILLSWLATLIYHGISLSPVENMRITAIWFIPVVILIAWNLSEVKSISENLAEMGAKDPIILWIPRFIEKVFKLWSDIIGKGLDSFAKYIASKIEDKGNNP